MQDRGLRTPRRSTAAVVGRANRVALALIGVGGGIAALVLGHERYVQRVAATARAAMVGLPPADRAAARAELAGCAQSRDERVLLSCVTGFAGLARGATPDAMHATDLAHGRQALSAFGTRVPDSGQARIAAALLASADAASGATAIDAIADSYHRQPYARDVGLWRLWYASHHWSPLDPATRRAVLAEAIWYASIGKTDREDVLTALDGTPALVSVLLRLPGQAGEALPLPATP